MGSKALDEESHGDDKTDAHEKDTVPVGLKKKTKLEYRQILSAHRDPLSNGEESVLVQQKVLESDQGTLCVNLPALEKDVAVSLEVITGRAGPQAQTLGQVPVCRLEIDTLNLIQRDEKTDFTSPLSAQSEVLRQLPFLPGSWVEQDKF